MRPHVPDEALTAAEVPDETAPWDAIAEFGHRFHAYKVAGSVQRVGTLTVATLEQWEQTGELPADLTRLRLCLFHTVRAVGLDGAPDPDTERWSRALVAGIAALVGGRSPDTRR